MEVRFEGVRRTLVLSMLDMINGKIKLLNRGPVAMLRKNLLIKVLLIFLNRLTLKIKIKNQSTTSNSTIDHQREDNFDEYREPYSEDEYDVDTQSVGEGIEPREEINTSDQLQKVLLLHSSNVDEIRDVTGKKSLSPRGRKHAKQNKLTSTSKPNTRARSRGI